MNKTKCDFCKLAQYKNGKLSCSLHWFSLNNFNKEYYCRKAKNDLLAHEDFHRRYIQISPHTYIPKEHYEEYLAELEKKQEQSEKVCKNCRYLDISNKLEGRDSYLCCQSTELMKQYVRYDDWCDRFTGASWVNREQENADK